MGPRMISAPSRAWQELILLEDLRRAWPGRDGTISYELVESATGLLRAGRIDASGRCRLLPFAHDPALPSLRPPRSGRLVVHRARRRAVIVSSSAVSKLVPAGRAARLSEFAALDCFQRVGLRTARVLACTPDRIDLEKLPGRTLGDLGDQGLTAWERLVESWPATAPAGPALPTHTAAAEIAVLREWTARAGACGALEAIDAAHGPGRFVQAVERACTELEESTGPLALSHRDLHDGQLLWDGSTLSILDLDTTALAEAALDVANLAVHTDLMRATGRLSPQAHDRIAGLLDDLAMRLPTTAQRLEAYEHASRLRLALVHAFRPATGDWLPVWTSESLEHTSFPTRWRS